MSPTKRGPPWKRGGAVTMPAACAAARWCERALRARHPRRSPPPGTVPRTRGGTASTRVPRGAHGPRRVAPGLNAATREPGPALLHHSPRTGGNPARVWTRPWRAEAGHAPGLSTTPRAWPTRREALVRLGVHGQRAHHGMVRPDPADACNSRHALGCSGAPPSIRTAPWAVTLPSGGGVRSRPRCRLGALARRAAAWHKPGLPRTRQAKRGPVMGSLGPRPTTGGDAVSMGVPSARSLAPGWPGVPHTVPPKAHGRACASGPMPPGTSARRSRHGSRATLVQPNRPGAVA
jgi:hypothetical protein